ncbi:hypothetical protein ACE1AT_04755 [Pelatocladus sp. BLCC-F211]|uniref:hypothetical protein n=1 Tax=Pelatocladus sp. BLCC-F211 TaxID=3342752 RepID=UPI0035B7F858
MMQTTIDDWIEQASNLKPVCEKIYGSTIGDRTWRNWERIAGAVYNQGRKVRTRHYTQEQAQMLLCVAWLRKQRPRLKLDYKSVRVYWNSRRQDIEAVLDAVVAGEIPPPPKPKPLVQLTQVKLCCDRILNRTISRECWRLWKQHLGIAKHIKKIDDATAALLVFIACWRVDHPNKPLPSLSHLLVMSRTPYRCAMTLETQSSAKQQHQWEMSGCQGKDLPRYLASHGYKVAPSTLYKWGKFQKRKHYSVAELSEWKHLAKEKRYAT